MKWSTPEVKQLNKELVRKAVKELGECTKSDVAKSTSLSVATCNTLLNEMLEAGELIKQDQEMARMGRPADRFSYNADYHHVLGISTMDIDGMTEIGICVSDALGNMLKQEVKRIVSATQMTIDEIIGAELGEDELIKAISIGIPGVSKDGIVERCDVKSLVGADLEGAFVDKYGVDVEVRNDMDFISCGIYNTKFHGDGNLATAYFPNIDSGDVGCGFVINGRILRGFTKFAGELGYVAEGFGINKAKKEELYKTHEGLVKYVAQTILIIITTIDPERVVIFGEGISEDDMAYVRNWLAEIVTKEHMPSIKLDNNIADNYCRGLTVAAINRLDFPLSNPI